LKKKNLSKIKIFLKIASESKNDVHRMPREKNISDPAQNPLSFHSTYKKPSPGLRDTIFGKKRFSLRKTT
jgi:hypothetical protein